MARAARVACAALLLIGATQVGNADASAYAFASGTLAATLTSAVGLLHTSGAKLMNAQGQEVHITGVNWFGLETDSFAPQQLQTMQPAPAHVPVQYVVVTPEPKPQTEEVTRVAPRKQEQREDNNKRTATKQKSGDDGRGGKHHG